MHDIALTTAILNERQEVDAMSKPNGNEQRKWRTKNQDRV
jgi:hypothetical protein